VVLAADTLVALEGEIIGKPRHFTEAREILRRLSDREHDVCTGVFIVAGPHRKFASFAEISRVRFRKLNDQAIDDYLRKVNPLDKAGAYAAQGRGGEIIASVEGSFTNVVGLPMEATMAALAQFGIYPRR
jgi:septum formation protein